MTYLVCETQTTCDTSARENLRSLLVRMELASANPNKEWSVNTVFKPMVRAWNIASWPRVEKACMPKKLTSHCVKVCQKFKTRITDWMHMVVCSLRCLADQCNICCTFIHSYLAELLNKSMQLCCYCCNVLSAIKWGLQIHDVHDMTKGKIAWLYKLVSSRQIQLKWSN